MDAAMMDQSYESLGEPLTSIHSHGDRFGNSHSKYVTLDSCSFAKWCLWLIGAAKAPFRLGKGRFSIVFRFICDWIMVGLVLSLSLNLQIMQISTDGINSVSGLTTLLFIPNAILATIFINWYTRSGRFERVLSGMSSNDNHKHIVKIVNLAILFALLASLLTVISTTAINFVVIRNFRVMFLSSWYWPYASFIATIGFIVYFSSLFLYGAGVFLLRKFAIQNLQEIICSSKFKKAIVRDSERVSKILYDLYAFCEGELCEFGKSVEWYVVCSAAWSSIITIGLSALYLLKPKSLMIKAIDSDVKNSFLYFIPFSACCVVLQLLPAAWINGAGEKTIIEAIRSLNVGLSYSNHQHATLQSVLSVWSHVDRSSDWSAGEGEGGNLVLNQDEEGESSMSSRQLRSNEHEHANPNPNSYVLVQVIQRVSTLRLRLLLFDIQISPNLVITVVSGLASLILVLVRLA